MKRMITPPSRAAQRRTRRYGTAVCIAMVAMAGSLAGCSGSHPQAAGRSQKGTTAGLSEAGIPWNNPLGKAVVNGKVTPALEFTRPSAAAEHLKGRHIPFSFRLLPATYTPTKVTTDPFSAGSAKETDVVVQYQTSHGLVDVIETSPGQSTATIRSEYKEYASTAAPSPGVTVESSGTALLVKVAGRYWGGMTIGPHGDAVTLVWHEGNTGYLVEGPELGKAFCLKLAAELAAAKPILTITASGSASASASASSASPSPSG